MATGEQTPEDVEFGKALCDRMGLVHGTTLREWKAQRVNDTMVSVTMTTMVMMSREEFEELRKVATKRVEEREK